VTVCLALSPERLLSLATIPTDVVFARTMIVSAGGRAILCNQMGPNYDGCIRFAPDICMGGRAQNFLPGGTDAPRHLHRARLRAAKKSASFFFVTRKPLKASRLGVEREATRVPDCAMMSHTAGTFFSRNPALAAASSLIDPSKDFAIGLRT